MSWEDEALAKHKPQELALICKECRQEWPCPTMRNWMDRKPKSKR